MSDTFNKTETTTCLEIEHSAMITAPWILFVYIGVIIGSGVVGNVLILVSILCGRLIGNSGPPYPLIMNVAAVDLLTLTHLAPFEIWTIAQEGVWRFHPGYCRLFLGLEMLLSTVNVYGLAAISLHNGRSPVMLVLILMWLLGISLSIPVFMFAGSVVYRSKIPLCSLLFPPSDSQYNQILLVKLSGAIFNVCIPVLILVVGTVTAALKLCGSTHHLQPSIRDALKLTLVLSLSFTILSLHRSIFSMLYVFFNTTETLSFRVTPFVSVTSPLATLIFSMLHYVACCVRPLFYCLVSADIKAAVKLIVVKFMTHCCCLKCGHKS